MISAVNAFRAAPFPFLLFPFLPRVLVLVPDLLSAKSPEDPTPLADPKPDPEPDPEPDPDPDPDPDPKPNAISRSISSVVVSDSCLSCRGCSDGCRGC
jgi:hypothetical protein